jgi:hypothetical protein
MDIDVNNYRKDSWWYRYSNRDTFNNLKLYEECRIK